MQRKKFADTSISLPCLGFGAMRLPINEDQSINYEKAAELFDYAMAHGVNYFDTAFGYHNGKSAEFVGECLSKYDRASYFLANKMPPWDVKAPEDFERIFQKQLSDLRTDYIDFYLLHSITDDNFERFLSLGAYDFCVEKKNCGAIRKLGFSFHGSPKTLEKMLDYGAWDFVQIQFNYLDYFAADAKVFYDMITDRGIPVFVMEPVRGGKLAEIPPRAKAELDKLNPALSPAAWALRWVMGFENVSIVLSGMSNADQVTENIALFSEATPLSDAENAAIYRAANEIRRIESIPCTACGYCTEVCPVGIKIPTVFDEYNKYLQTKDMTAFRENYAAACAEGQRAVDCIKCGACAAKCPQGIEIPDVLSLMPKLKTE